MIRAALITVFFMASVLALVVLQPRESRSPEDATTGRAGDMTVARARTEFDAIAAPAENMSLLSDTIEEQVRLPARITVPVKAEALRQAAMPVESDDARETQPVMTPEAAQLAPEILAGTSQDLEDLIVSALTQGQSEAYIDALVKHAAQQGGLEIPPTLLDEDGRIDTASVISALQIGGLAAGMEEVYEIQPGDSLTAISYRFFGSTIHAMDIFNANRDVLTSPTRLVAGVEIVVPPF